MKLNKTLAIALHRAMWTDMQTELGDNPSPEHRAKFKLAWTKEHFPNECIMHNCFLCEYAFKGDNPGCSACPIRWPEGRCAGSNFSYATDPICNILALPEKNKLLTCLEEVYVANDKKASATAYYRYREEILSRASGIPGFASIEDHVKAIQEKAVEEYFEKTPGAKLASMDVDQAFKQYAKEQKAPIFKELAAASGLSEYYESVSAHIYEIKRRAKQDGRDYERERIMNKIREMLNDQSAGETKNS